MTKVKRIGVLTIKKIHINDVIFIFFFSEVAIHAILSSLFGFIGLAALRGIVVFAFHVLIGITIILSILTESKTKIQDALILYLGIGLAFLISYWLNPAVGSWYLDEEYGILAKVFTVTGGILAYIVIRLQNNKERIFENLKICNIIWIVYLLYAALNRIQLGYWVVSSVHETIVHLAYHMSYGYYCTFICLLNYFLWKREKKKIYIPIAAIFCVLSLAFGSRGVVMVYMLLVIVEICTSLKKAKMMWKRTLLILLIIISAISIFAFYSQILGGMQSLFSVLGIESRTLDSLVIGEFTEANGRDRMWQMAYEMICEQFPFGYGVYGDRPVIGQSFGWGYCHNIFLELLISFGLLGAVISVFLIFYSIRLINSTDDSDWNKLFKLFFVNCGQLLISNSFWYLSYFWAALAIGVSYTRAIKKPKELRQCRNSAFNQNLSNS